MKPSSTTRGKKLLQRLIRKTLNRLNQFNLHMPFKFKDLGKLLKKTFAEWYEKDPFRQSAVIAYYAIFSMPGLLVLIITIAGYFFGKDAVSENIFTQISKTMGTETAIQIKEMLANASKAKATILGSIIGILILISGAMGVFVELQ